MAAEVKHPARARGPLHTIERVNLAYSRGIDAEWMFTCRHCGAINFKTLACPCGAEYYCSSECQKARWKEEHSIQHGSMYPEISKEELQRERQIWRELRDALHEPDATPTLMDVITPDSRHFRLPWFEAACLLGHDPNVSILMDVTLNGPVRIVGIIHLDRNRHRYIMRSLRLVPDIKRIREKNPGHELRLQPITNIDKPLTEERETYVYRKGMNRRSRRQQASKLTTEAKEDQDCPDPEPTPYKKKKKKKKKTKKKT